jgi:hypothetical protein
MATPPKTPVAHATGTFSGGAVRSCSCIRCRTVYPPHLVEWAFRVNQSGRKRLCCMCERESRQNQRNPYVVKAHSVIRRHAERLKIGREDLVTIYGWDPQILAQDAEHQYAGRCNYSHEPYIELADITLDIQDRRRKPRRLRLQLWRQQHLRPRQQQLHRTRQCRPTRLNEHPPVADQI